MDVLIDFNRSDFKNGSSTGLLHRSSVVKQLVQYSLLLGAFLLLCPFTASAQTSPPELVSQVKRAIVIVSTYDDQKNALQQGSGFFISSDRIVTNFHVVESAKEIRIKAFTGETVSVLTVVAQDRQADLAILQIPAPCRETSSLAVADIGPAKSNGLVVVTNPSGSWRVTTDHSGAAWHFENLHTNMQITASLAPGGRVDPVVKIQGHVIGKAVLELGP
jgi:S1-C subfamily serine protease